MPAVTAVGMVNIAVWSTTVQETEHVGVTGMPKPDLYWPGNSTWTSVLIGMSVAGVNVKV